MCEYRNVWPLAEISVSMQRLLTIGHLERDEVDWKSYSIRDNASREDAVFLSSRHQLLMMSAMQEDSSYIDWYTLVFIERYWCFLHQDDLLERRVPQYFSYLSVHCSFPDIKVLTCSEEIFTSFFARWRKSPTPLNGVGKSGFRTHAGRNCSFERFSIGSLLFSSHRKTPCMDDRASPLGFL